MQSYQLSGKKQRTKKRVGRGGKRGTFSGRGVKGQKARAGAKIRPAWRDLIKQIPKRRGYRFKPVAGKSVIINIGAINNSFKEGEVVSPDALLKCGLVSKIKGRTPEVKILGEGELNKKLSFKDVEISGGAKDKIKKAGGSIS
ncbi:MAG: 50S ribosomal protein L15 [bacterium]